MREEEDSFVSVTRDRKLRQRFTLGVPRTFDQDCSFWCVSLDATYPWAQRIQFDSGGGGV